MTAGFNYYRTLPQDAALVKSFYGKKLTMPVLAIAGAHGVGHNLAKGLANDTTSLQSIIIEDSGHFVAEEDPKAFTAAVLEFLSLNAAMPIVKTDGQVTKSQQKLIINAFSYLNKFWADQGKSLSREETQKYFTQDTTLIINGKTVYTGYDQFDTHFRAVGKSIRGKVRFPLIEMMRAGNKLIVHFNEDIYDNNGALYPANVMAVFTLHNGKIQTWEEVVNTPYFCQPGYAKIVYSK